MNKTEKVILGTTLTIFSLLIALGMMSEVERQAFRLTLTNEGCAFAQSIALPVEKKNLPCSVDANFQPFSISNGGILYTRDDKTIQIRESMLLASTILDSDLSLTPKQRFYLKCFYLCIGVAIVTALYTVSIKCFSKD